MNRDGIKIMALAGAALLAAGVFLPVIRVPKRGNMTLMELESAGTIVLVLAGVAAAIALIGWTRHVLWPGIAALGLLAFAYQRTNAEIAQSRSRLGVGVGEDPLAAIRDLAASNSSLEYGWAVMAVAALLVVAVAAIIVLYVKTRSVDPAEQARYAGRILALRTIDASIDQDVLRVSHRDDVEDLRRKGRDLEVHVDCRRRVRARGSPSRGGIGRQAISNESGLGRFVSTRRNPVDECRRHGGAALRDDARPRPWA